MPETVKSTAKKPPPEGLVARTLCTVTAAPSRAVIVYEEVAVSAELPAMGTLNDTLTRQPSSDTTSVISGGMETMEPNPSNPNGDKP